MNTTADNTDDVVSDQNIKSDQDLNSNQLAISGRIKTQIVEYTPDEMMDKFATNVNYC